jgi:hypothetical protein
MGKSHMGLASLMDDMRLAFVFADLSVEFRGNSEQLTQVLRSCPAAMNVFLQQNHYFVFHAN